MINVVHAIYVIINLKIFVYYKKIVRFFFSFSLSLKNLTHEYAYVGFSVLRGHNGMFFAHRA